MFRILMARFLVLLFVLLVLPVSFLWIFSHTYLTRDFYRNDLVDFTYDFFTLHAPDYLEIEELKNIPKDELRASFRNIFSKKDLMEFAELSLDDIENSLKNVQNDQIRIRISLALIAQKKSLIADEVGKLLYDNLSRCTPDFSKSGDNSIKGFDCIPENMDKSEFEFFVRGFLNREVFTKIPGELYFDLGLPRGLEGNLLGSIDETVSWLFMASMLFLALDLFLLAFVVMGSWNQILRWEMKPFMISGFLFMMLTVFLFFIPEILAKILDGRIDIISGENLNILIEAIDFFLIKLIENILIFVTPVLVLSFLTWIYCVLYSRKLKKYDSQ